MRAVLALCILGMVGAWVSHLSLRSEYRNLALQVQALKKNQMERDYLQSTLDHGDGTATIVRTYYDEYPDTRAAIAAHLADVQDPPVGTPKCTTWISGGIERKVTTYRENGQTEEAWCALHDERVAAGKKAFPPDKR